MTILKLADMLSIAQACGTSPFFNWLSRDLKMIEALIDGKTKGTLQPFNLAQTDGFVASVDLAGLVLKDKTAKRCVFADLALKEADIDGCDFSYSIFINCYFRGAKFKGVNLTGCKFFDCNFRGASLVNCRLPYTKWKDTHIAKDMILANLPSFPNVAQELLISMRINASSIGEYSDARTYLYQSESLSRAHLKKVITCFSNYYKKYTLSDRIKAIVSLSRSYVERFFWGYGEKPGTLILSASIIVTLFAIYYRFHGVAQFSRAERLSALVFSGNIFSLSTSLDANEPMWSTTLESLFGIVFIGFLAASLHRRISTRKE